MHTAHTLDQGAGASGFVQKSAGRVHSPPMSHNAHLHDQTPSFGLDSLFDDAIEAEAFCSDAVKAQDTVGRLRLRISGTGRKSDARLEEVCEDALQRLGDLEASFDLIQAPGKERFDVVCAIERQVLESARRIVRDTLGKFEKKSAAMKARVAEFEQSIRDNLAKLADDSTNPLEGAPEPARLFDRFEYLKQAERVVRDQVTQHETRLAQLEQEARVLEARLGRRVGACRKEVSALLSSRRKTVELGPAAACVDEQQQTAHTPGLQASCPERFLVVVFDEAVVRSECAISSKQLGTLKKGDVVQWVTQKRLPPASTAYVEVVRYQIAPTARFPQGGWVSNKSRIAPPKGSFPIAQAMGNVDPPPNESANRCEDTTAVHAAAVGVNQEEHDVDWSVYRKMCKAGVPVGAVRQHMRLGGIPPEQVEAFLPSVSAQTAASRNEKPKEEVARPLAKQVEVWSAVVGALQTQAMAAEKNFNATVEALSPLMSAMEINSRTIDQELAYWDSGEGGAKDITPHALERLRARIGHFESELDNYLEHPTPSMDFFLQDEDS